MIPPVPTADQLAAAFRGGAKVRFGLPTHVPIEDGWAALDLAAASRGQPDPWVCVVRRHGITFVASDTDRTIAIGDLAVAPSDWGAVDQAVREVPVGIDRHCPEAEAMRLRAGRAAMRVTDTMVRARLLDAIDGWGAVLGELIDQSSHGRLHESSDPLIRCRLIRVVCPSTGRAYVHRVPAEHATAQAARRWMMLDWFDEAEVET